jgi:F-type H+-transporting ATPase subunit epsilon
LNLKILLPFKIFSDTGDVSRVVVQTSEGSFGLLPHRRDCVAALVPGILLYESDATGEAYVAIDEGVLVKSGADVLVSVRRAIAGTDLQQLRHAVEHEFLVLDRCEKDARNVMAKLEAGFLHRLAAIQHD